LRTNGQVGPDRRRSASKTPAGPVTAGA